MEDEPDLSALYEKQRKLNIKKIQTESKEQY